MAFGKTIELFLVNGTADGLVTAELSNWNGKAIKIPRIEVASCNLDDLRQVGVYFLFCREDDGTDSVYIGEAENIKERLRQHIRDYQAEKEKFFWNTAVIFIGRDLNQAHIRYLEDRLVKMAREANRYKVLTKNTYGHTAMKASQIAVMEEFLSNIRILINALGYKVLEPLVRLESDSPIPEEDMLYLSIGNASARGKITTEGFVLLKGAKVNENTSEKSLGSSLAKRREKLFGEGKIRDLVTTEDLLISSSSAAAGIVLGYTVPGPKAWKDKNGRTLKEIEQETEG